MTKTIGYTPVFKLVEAVSQDFLQLQINQKKNKVYFQKLGEEIHSCKTMMKNERCFTNEFKLNIVAKKF